MAKKDKKGDPKKSPGPVEPTVETAMIEVPVMWDEKFDTATHKDFLRMSAEAMQASMNLALHTGDVEKLLQVASSWGMLAITTRDLERSRQTAGFGASKEEDTNG